MVRGKSSHWLISLLENIFPKLGYERPHFSGKNNKSLEIPVMKGKKDESLMTKKIPCLSAATYEYNHGDINAHMIMKPRNRHPQNSTGK